ncbi:MAG TPA: hypothetical protein VGP63_30635 [Planctomycetaceae bacterium]|jgi:hypothetical protein|nr:hypothetical protein [Planctomycetaceae bacterium]
MLESTQATQTDLQRGLNELEMLGLMRPSNVLFAEYLRALTADDVVDVATAAKLSAAYNRARYSPVSEDDPQLRDAVEALERVAAGVAAMPAQSRKQLARSLSERLISTSVEPMLERETDALNACVTPVPATRTNRVLQKHGPTPRDTTPGKTRERSERPSRSFAQDDLMAAFAPSFLRRIASLPRVSLVFSALAAVATFGGGYFLHLLAPSRPAMSEKRPEMSDAPLGGRNLNAPAATNLVPHAKLLLDGVRSRAVEEMRARHYGKARLGLELVLAYSPDNPYVLNDLALIYLTPSQDGTADPKRALQLIERALQLTREPAVLDTAAEAQFQCGNLHDAISLEDESMANAFEPDDENDDFRTHRLNQLQKFQGAAQIRTADRLPATSNENASPDSGSVKRVDPAAAAGHSKSPANPKIRTPWRLQIPGSRLGLRNS